MRWRYVVSIRMAFLSENLLAHWLGDAHRPQFSIHSELHLLKKGTIKSISILQALNYSKSKKCI